MRSIAALLWLLLLPLLASRSAPLFLLCSRARDSMPEHERVAPTAVVVVPHTHTHTPTHMHTHTAQRQSLSAFGSSSSSDGTSKSSVSEGGRAAEMGMQKDCCVCVCM